MQKQFMVVSYDISNDKSRRKVMKTLEDFGRRVQFSVFECQLYPDQIKTLKNKLQLHIKDTQDSIRFYSIGAEDINRIQILGFGKVSEEKLFFFQ